MKPQLPKNSDDLPATRKMLHLVRDELRSDIHAVDLKVDALAKNMDSRFSALDSKFANIDSKFANIDSKFASIDSKFAGIDSQLADLKSTLELIRGDVRGMAVNVEYQKDDNKVTYEHYHALAERQDRQEKRLEEMHETLRFIAGQRSNA